MEKMERHKRCVPSKALSSLPSFKLKCKDTETVKMNDEQDVEQYLTTVKEEYDQILIDNPKTADGLEKELTAPSVDKKPEQIISCAEKYLKTGEEDYDQILVCKPKPANVFGNKLTASVIQKPKRIISLDSDMILSKPHINQKSSHVENTHFSVFKNTNGNNDRLVIELNDYLALKNTKNIAKFKLKPISDESDKTNASDSVNTKNDNLFHPSEVSKSVKPTKRKVSDSNNKSHKTFLLVPQKSDESVHKKPKLSDQQVIEKKYSIPLIRQPNSTVKRMKKIEQINCQISKNQLAEVLKGSKNVSIKVIDPDQGNLQPNKSKIKPLTKVKKVQDTQSNINKSVNSFTQKRSKSNIVLRAHPFFSQHTPFIIKHKPVATKGKAHQNIVVMDGHQSLINAEVNFVKIDEHHELLDQIKCDQMQEPVVKLESAEESESIDQIFPVALETIDSPDFEHFKVEDIELPTESEMQILGI